jgi:hypothetical protein
VGFTGDVAPGTSSPSGGLVEYWDGTRWLIAGTPGSSAETLNAVAGTGPDDVWAVGTQNSEASGQPGTLNMAAHRNGKTWTVVPTPNLGNSVSQTDVPTGVTAISAKDVWASGVEFTGCQAAVGARSGPRLAVGGRSPAMPLALRLRPGGLRRLPGATGQCLVPYVLHWDGTTWSLSTTPDPGGFGTALERISALSASDIWAIGQTQSPANGPVRTLTERFNGSSWTTQASPDPGNAGNDELFAVATPGGHQFDAVGGAAVAGDPCLTDVSGTFCLRTLALDTTSG